MAAVNAIAARFRRWKAEHVPGWPDQSAFRVWAIEEGLEDPERREVWKHVQRSLPIPGGGGGT